MEALIEEIVRKLHHLPEVKILEVLDFVEFLTWNKERLISQQIESDVTSQKDQEFEAIANQVADEFATFVGLSIPVLSDYAVSRAGIYEEHP
jgi:hypothetical protein